MIQWFLILLFSITCQKASATPIPFAIDSSASKVPTFLGADKWDNGYPESRYQSVLAKVKDLYAPLIQGLGGELIFIADWTDGAVNMWAERLGDSYILEVPGGFPRYYLINEEAFLLTICHELGHLIGGEPKSGTISFEGQADYFSTLECSEKLFEAVEPIKASEPSESEISFCKGPYNGSRESCLRHTSGMLSVTSLFAEILGDPIPSLEIEDKDIVSQTLSSHPNPQCRLDTLKAGFLKRSRPACWYKSQSNLNG